MVQSAVFVSVVDVFFGKNVRGGKIVSDHEEGNGGDVEEASPVLNRDCRVDGWVPQFNKGDADEEAKDEENEDLEGDHSVVPQVIDYLSAEQNPELFH